MQKTPVGKITVITELLSPDSYSNTHRLLEQLQSARELDKFLINISPFKIITFKGQLYASEMPAIIHILKSFLPDYELTVIAKKVRSKEDLIGCLVNSSICSSITNVPVSKLPTWHHEFCESHSSKPIFSKTIWAKILAKHRTTVYSKKSALKSLVSSTQTHCVDIASALQNFPNLRRKS